MVGTLALGSWIRCSNPKFVLFCWSRINRDDNFICESVQVRNCSGVLISLCLPVTPIRAALDSQTSVNSMTIVIDARFKLFCPPWMDRSNRGTARRAEHQQDPHRAVSALHVSTVRVFVSGECSAARCSRLPRSRPSFESCVTPGGRFSSRSSLIRNFDTR